MVALKLGEVRERRDVMVMVFLMYFLLITHFFFSQEIWTTIYLLLSCVTITALLIECQHLGALAPRQTLRKARVMVAQALRSEERRVGKECVRTCRSGGAP